MLCAKELTSVLSRMFEKKTEFPGLTNVMLVDDEGSLLGAAKSPDSMGSKNDHLSYCSAVLASVYNEYKAAETCIGAKGTLKSIIYDTKISRVACRELWAVPEDAVQPNEERGKVLICVMGTPGCEIDVILKVCEILRINLACLQDVFDKPSGRSSRPY